MLPIDLYKQLLVYRGGENCYDVRRGAEASMTFFIPLLVPRRRHGALLFDLQFLHCLLQPFQGQFVHGEQFFY